jgi:hypothetical protein
VKALSGIDKKNSNELNKFFKYSLLGSWWETL